ncbi:TerC family protein [Gloeobacter kilaueensis]|uniref:Membrane protein TerC n=1 Tax=Gloeobacter kilaueensis (strain ATCC BAA-2537 / CCAP 1431/1 / ULC 316 / JS1) TaxID=1183438 RepID=U5QPL3_GLOK1|nr:TerC family protein [Gloeobacter kilaueensis]AGY59635.1 membrane protein TerC [Gloeobacter kilaueensis JS1]
MWENLYRSLGMHMGVEPWDFAIILALVFVEGALSADNAAVLAALTRSLPTKEQRRRSLRYGIIGAFVLRFFAVLFAAWLIHNWALKLAGALYLIYLALSHFLKGQDNEEGCEDEKVLMSHPLVRGTLGRLSPFWRVIVLVELTDIAFSVDSITAAVAFSNKAWVVIVGGILGIVTMRYIAEIFIKLIDVYVRLEAAAFLAVGFVGLKMLTEVVFELVDHSFETPEWLVLGVVATIFGWGFSKKKLEVEEEISLRP